MKDLLTIGMACYDDFHGVFFTCQALKMYHKAEELGIEIIIIDNNPNSSHGKAVKNYAKTNSYIRYIPFEDAQGTTQSREAVFKHATRPYVLCMDCHVLLAPDAITRLLEYYQANPDTKDILTGPLLYDNGRDISTHFDLYWRGEMWGVWSHAYESSDGEIFCLRDKGGQIAIHRVSDGYPLRTLDIPYKERFGWLAQNNHKVLGLDDDDEPFEIQAQGLGVFSCKKENWVGFNPNFRKFGGEEGYIHEKFRNAGGRAMCLPFLKWNHRFNRPDGVPYPLDKLSKMRNYIIGFKELDLDLGSVYQHFVTEGGVSIADWNKLVERPDTRIVEGKIQDERPNPNFTIDQYVEWTYSQDKVYPRSYMDFLRPYIDRCDSATEYTYSPHTSAMFVGADLRRLDTILTHHNDITPFARYIALKKKPLLQWGISMSDKPKIAWCEFLLINGRANKESIEYMLDQSDMVGRYIAIHNIVGYASKGDDGGEGMAASVDQFLRDNPEWFIVDLCTDSRGIVLLSKDPVDQPKETIYLAPPGHGPGTQLSRSLSWFGIKASPNCSCKKRAQIMDMKGCYWCEENAEDILDWLAEEAKKRGLPFIRKAARMILNRSIKRAKKERRLI